MPILVGEQPVIPLFPPHIAEAPQMTWTDALGRVTHFTDWENGWVLQPGTKGLDMPSYAFTTDESPGIDGTFVRQVRGQAKDITLPIAFWCDDSRAAYLTRRRGLIRSLNPKLGPGTLTVTHPDGETRHISCYYTAGMEGDESLDASGMRWTMTTLTFNCPSPLWYGEPANLQFETAQTGPFLPLLPLRVRDSQVLGGVQVDNPGDDLAYPVWTLKGPATSITLTNSTSGLTLELAHTMTSSDTLVIDTREREQTVTLNGTDNLWPALSDTSDLWGLEADLNILVLTVLGADTPTELQLTYSPRFLAA
ncbi:phage distal tail protein [Streptomyces sp. H27-D2]|uniref:phage distal tail protein n=1 Tax=Streptomyces sp. H27-D2 TaxID=3046304 RepID=UPI002DC03711|nr:phage tail family protein [Streptomyces sp. H27-D2]MEC4016103.1 phage tail family protein [Streptomyces sp. H27-D2]